MGHRLRAGAPVLVAGAIAVALVVVLQIHGRGWLAYDEAARVEPGYRLSLLLDAHQWGGTWGWLNDQTFYPFLTPTIHGLLLWAGVDPLSAAWLPSLLGYAAAGLLAARLVQVLGGGGLGALLAAVLFWSAPLEMRLGSGAFTEPLGVCVDLALLLMLVRLQRGDDRTALLAAAGLVAVASWIKWDYGIAAALTVGVVAAVVPGARRRTLLALGGGVAIAAALLAVNAPAKLDGLRWYIGQAAPGQGQQMDFVYYLRQLLPGADQVDLSLPASVLLLAGVATAVAGFRRRSELRPLVVMAAVLYVMYSLATVKHPRYVAMIIPPLAVLAGVGVGPVVAAAAHRWIGARRTRGDAVAGVATAGVLALLVAMQAAAMGVRLPWLDPNVGADRDRARAATEVAAAAGPVLLLGSDNWVSPAGLRLIVEMREHRAWWEVTTAPSGRYTVVHGRR